MDRQTYIHTHNFRNAVMLVWGSLRLTPITCTMCFILSMHKCGFKPPFKSSVVS